MPSTRKLDKKPSRLYGRKQTRPPKGERKEALEELLPKLRIELSPTPSPLVPFGNLPPSLSPDKRGEGGGIKGGGREVIPSPQIWLEIGFGNGEHLKALMERHPDRFYIGAEPFVNGMSAFLRSIKDMPHDNIRVWMDDAIILVDAMPNQYLDGIYVLNPDPWPKKRHHKRRIISQENLTRFARVLKPGGALIMATDVSDLAEWMVTQASNHPAFEWTAERADDWRVIPADWIKTRYEEKGEKAGRKQSYMIFAKR